MKDKAPKTYDYSRSWNYVLWLLGRKMYTEAQLRDKLRRKEAEAETIERVMARLKELKFLDDAGFAEAYVNSRRGKKGRLALKQELFQKGIAETLVEETLEPLDTETQVQAALGVLEKQTWRFQKAPPEKRRAKAYAFLARRGFTGDVVREALERSEELDEE